MNHRITTVAGTLAMLLAAVLLAGACTGANAEEDVIADEPAGQDEADDFDSEQARRDAEALVGVAEQDLPADTRIARRGNEQYMLTEDYVLGRMTVELDDDGSGTLTVVSVTVELPEGPETFTA